VKSKRLRREKGLELKRLRGERNVCRSTTSSSTRGFEENKRLREEQEDQKQRASKENKF
jgi:hypothetical protein